jgi:hypothetical protein
MWPPQGQIKCQCSEDRSIMSTDVALQLRASLYIVQPANCNGQLKRSRHVYFGSAAHSVLGMASNKRYKEVATTVH